MASRRKQRTRGPLRLSGAATSVVLALSAPACKDMPSDPTGDAQTPQSGIADTVTVVIENFAFRSPNGTDSLTISLGQTVRFINREAAPHTATSTSAPTGDAGFDSGRLGSGQEYYWTPSVAGAWVYRCDFHPLDMSGAVIRVGGADIPPDDGGGSAGPDTIQVDIVNFSFRGPDGTSQIAIAPGQTLKFVNRDEADHTVTATAAPPGGVRFDSGNLEPGQVFYWTAAQTGSWGYRCDYHPEMVGAVVVSDSTGGGDDDDSGTPVTIEIVDGGFVGPDGDGHVTISLGDAVRWVNAGAQVHTASARSAPDGAQRFDSGDLLPGDSFSFTPDRIGVWRYRCDEHSGEPEGSITVE